MTVDIARQQEGNALKAQLQHCARLVEIADALRAGLHEHILMRGKHVEAHARQREALAAVRLQIEHMGITGGQPLQQRKHLRHQLKALIRRKVEYHALHVHLVVIKAQ